MSTLTVRDNSIWIKHIETDPATVAFLGALPGGARLLMEVDGVRGEWEKMADGKDGRPTNGLKPVGTMKDSWTALQSRRGDRLNFKIIERKDTYLSAVQAMFTEWDSDEDESAFHAL